MLAPAGRLSACAGHSALAGMESKIKLDTIILGLQVDLVHSQMRKLIGKLIGSVEDKSAGAAELQ